MVAWQLSCTIYLDIIGHENDSICCWHVLAILQLPTIEAWGVCEHAWCSDTTHAEREKKMVDIHKVLVLEIRRERTL
jgi:hypothetical protein